MNPSQAESSPVSAIPLPGFLADRMASAWWVGAALAMSAIVWMLAWYMETAQSIVAIWQRSETFEHGFLVAPISAWLIWTRRKILAALDVRPSPYVLVLIALTGFGWLFAHLGGVGTAQQYALVLMIPLFVWAIVGTAAARAMAFPLFFLLLGVPFGEFLLPPLMESTADFTVFALRMTGIPVYREGMYFTIPSGNWSVVEACSGLRYLIASVTLGLLYAHLTYRSFVRKAAFVTASVVAPIVANWLRAYLIVMIGHLSGMKYAVGIDHLIYGWLFFGLVMLLLFWAGSFWREDSESVTSEANPAPQSDAGTRSRALLPVVALSAAAISTAWPLAAAHLSSGWLGAPPLHGPIAVGGWEAAPGRLADWTPRFMNSRARVEQTYVRGNQRVSVYIAYYRNQRGGTQLISSQNALVSSTDAEWITSGARPRTAEPGNVPLIETQLRGRSTRLLVWQSYWVDGRYTVNPYWAKLLQAKSALFGGGDDGAVVIAYTELESDRQEAARRLEDFYADMLPQVTRALHDAH